MIMTESTGYLDMNKKNLCHPNKTNQLSFVLFFKKKGFLFFKPSRTRSIDRSLLTQKNLPPKSPRNTLPSIVSYSLRPEKKISMLFSKKNFFFHPRPGFELTLKRSWFPPQRAPSARRCRRFPARARPPPPPPPPPLHTIFPRKKTTTSNPPSLLSIGVKETTFEIPAKFVNKSYPSIPIPLGNPPIGILIGVVSPVNVV